MYFADPKAKLPQCSFKCFHSSITLNECLSCLLWVTTLRDLQKKANKQAGVLPGNCRLFLWHWAQSSTLSLLYTSTPKTLEEREHRSKHNAFAGIWSPLLTFHHILRWKSRDPRPHLSQRNYWLHGDGALTPRCHGRKLPVRTQDVIHLAYGVSGTDARCVWSACCTVCRRRGQEEQVQCGNKGESLKQITRH